MLKFLFGMVIGALLSAVALFAYVLFTARF